MTGALGNANRGVHGAVTQLAAMYFRSAGFEGAQPRPYRAKISDDIESGVLRPDVEGVEGVHVRVSTRGDSLRLGGDLDATRRAAALNARGDVGVLVQLRKGESPISEAFAVLALADLARLLGGSTPRP